MPSPFRPANELMVQYAAYHRDRRNIATHFVGIPLIVLAVGVFLARAQFDIAEVHLSAAWVLWAVTAAWYLSRGNLMLGVATAAVNGLLIWGAHPLAVGSTGAWLACGFVTFITGWVLQFIGHYYEGRKPAFVDDLVGLLLGNSGIMPAAAERSKAPTPGSINRPGGSFGDFKITEEEEKF